MFDRVLAISQAGRLFSSRMYSYDIDVWENAGQRRLSELRGPRLNDPMPLPEGISRDNPPPNRIYGLRAPDEGHLWVAMARRRANWLAHWDNRANAPRPGIILDSLYGGRIDLIDLPSKRIVARAEAPQIFVGFLDDDHILAARYLEDGTPQFVVSKLTFTPSARR